jgi:hypothetical protein
MDKKSNIVELPGPRNGACENYSYGLSSVVSGVTKTLGMASYLYGGNGPDPNYSFKSCSNCGMHYNYHKPARRGK